MATGPVSFTAYVELLKGNRNFRLLWLSQLVSETGNWLYSVAIYSLLLELTQSAQVVAVAIVLQVLPQFFIAPMAGVVNDRISRRKVMIFADLARACVIPLMIAATASGMVGAIYVLLIIESCLWGFFEPGRSAVIPNVTRNNQETLVANALGSTTWSFTLAVGSFIGGMLAVAFGRNTMFLINAGTFLISAMFLRGMRFEEPHLAESKPLHPKDLADFSPVLEGIRYVWNDRRLVATLLAKTGLGFLGAHWVILPIYGERIFPIGTEILGPERAAMLGMAVLMGSRGIGALVGPLIGGRWAGSRQVRLRSGIVAGFLAVSVGYIALSAAPTVFPALLAIILAHGGSSVVWVFSTTLLHYQTENRFRGRVFSADFAFLVVSLGTVSYTSGTAVDLGVTARQVAMATGLIAIIPALLWQFVGLRQWRLYAGTDNVDG